MPGRPPGAGGAASDPDRLGGALRAHPDWRRATPAEVLSHPVWSMGPRITVDSALLVNKGLESIEAQVLFGLGWEQLGAVLHPQTIVHAMATFRDGSTVVQAAVPDMRLPIQLALSWPERWARRSRRWSRRRWPGSSSRRWRRAGSPPSTWRWRAAPAAPRRACSTRPTRSRCRRSSKASCRWLGAGDLGEVLERHRPEPVESLEQALERVDAWARQAARAAAETR